jgi:hypothetical protein
LRRIWGTYKVREQAKTAQGVNGCLGGFGLLLAVHIRDEGYMDESEVIPANAELELTHCFDERSRLDITDSSAQLKV